MRAGLSEVEVFREVLTNAALRKNMPVYVLRKQELANMAKTEIAKKYEISKSDLNVQWGDNNEMVSVFTKKPEDKEEEQI